MIVDGSAREERRQHGVWGHCEFMTVDGSAPGLEPLRVHDSG